jgi:hypothetical protein
MGFGYESGLKGFRVWYEEAVPVEEESIRIDSAFGNRDLVLEALFGS